MCGIAGLVENQRITELDYKNFTNILRSFNHRGPDHSDTWISESDNVILGHNRLAILDLSPSGNQPMMSSSKNLVIVFNGEIYNFKQLKSKILRAQGCI